MLLLSTIALSIFVAAGGSNGQQAQQTGQYRGPVGELFVSFPGPGPAQPAFPQNPLAGTGDTIGALEGYNRWEFWFEINKDVLLRSRDFRRKEVLFNVPPEPTPVSDDGKVRLEEARNRIAPALQAALKSSDPRVVRNAALGLGRIGAREAIAELEALASNSDMETRRFAVIALGMMDDRVVLSKLVNLVMNPGSVTEIRTAAALALGLQGRKEGARFLRDFVEKTLNVETAGGDDRDLYVASIVALGLCRDRDTAPILISRFRVIQPMSSARTKAVECALLQAIGRIGDPSGLVPLLEGMAAKDVQIRRSAAQALGDLGDRTAVKVLVTALEDDNDEQTRGFAAISLGRLGGEPARDALRKAFFHKGSRTTKTFSAIGLGLLGDSGFAPELLKALELNSEDDSRGSFAIALGLLRDTKALETLFKIVENRGTNADLRGYCAIAIGLIRAEGTFARLLKILEEDTDKVDLWRRAVCIGVGLFNEPKAGAALTKVLETDKREMVREHAALALNMTRSRAQIQPLISLFEREGMKGDIALYCVSALAGLGDRYEYPVLSEIFFNANYRVRSMVLEEMQKVL